MPSPLAHAAMGYAIYRLSRSRLPQEMLERVGPFPRIFLTTVGLSMLPDLDAIPGVLLGNLDQFHNNVTHSLMSGLVMALSVGGLAQFRQSSGFWRWFSLTLLCYELHVIMDFFTIGRGVMIFWPFTAERYEPTVKLFYGLHRSEGWLSIEHIWTLLNELGLTAIVGVAVHAFFKSKSREQPGIIRSLRAIFDEREL